MLYISATKTFNVNYEVYLADNVAPQDENMKDGKPQSYFAVKL